MNTENTSLPKLAYIKGFLWFAFGGTAMISAFTLPLHVLLLVGGRVSIMRFNNFTFRTYFFIVIWCGLYHGLYRMVTVLEDLGVKRGMRAISVSLGALGIATTLVAAWLIFFVFE